MRGIPAIMRYKKRRLFEDLVASGARPGDPNFIEKVNQQLKRFFVVNEQTVSQKSLDEIASEASKFGERVKKFWKHTKVQGHIDRIPKENAFFDQDIVIVIERTQFVPVPPPLPSTRLHKPFEDKSRSGKFAAAKDVRTQHDDGAILMASYGAAKATGQTHLAKIIKESAIDANNAAKAVEGLTAESK